MAMIYMNTFNKQQRKNGMVLVTAMIISAIVLLIGLNIANIAAKQLYLTSFSKESQTALFMADSMLECALYWDGVYGDGVNKGTDASGNYYFPPPGGSGASNSTNIECLGYEIKGSSDIQSNTPQSANPRVSTFGIQADNNGGVLTGPTYNQPCAQVTITKTDNAGVVDTAILAKGFNTCDPNNPRRVQRGLEVTY